jgi:hypothetical protein
MDQYEIVFKGEVMPNLHVEQVAGAMAKLFNADADKIALLFNGAAHALKSGLDREAAEKYRDILKRAGAIVYLRRMGIADRISGSRKTTGSQGGLSVAPMVGNLMRDEERPVVAAIEVDTSAIEMAPNDGKPLQTPRGSPPPEAPDTSHISIAPVNTSLGEASARAPAPAAINTDHLQLATGEINPTQAPDAQITAPDTSHLLLQPQGDILTADERPAPLPTIEFTHDFDLYPLE